MANLRSSPTEQAAELNEAKRTLAELESEIKQLQSQGYSVNELNEHIDKLHEYNEVKDATQLVLGQLAVFEGVTVKKMHQKYHLDQMSE